MPGELVKRRRTGVHQHESNVRRSFLKKHHHLFAFVGALLVFLTFVVKEGLQERVRSVVDSLQRAEDIFTIRTDNHVNLMELRTIMAMLQDVEDAGKVKESGERHLAMMFETKSELDRDSMSLDALEHLLEDAGVHGDIKNDVDAERRTHDALENKYKASLEYLFISPEEWTSGVMKPIPHPQESIDELNKEVSKLEQSIVAIRETSASLTLSECGGKSLL
jgi:hypothetical protein